MATLEQQIKYGYRGNEQMIAAELLKRIEVLEDRLLELRTCDCKR